MGPCDQSKQAWHATFTVVHGLEPEASFDEEGESLVVESTPEFRIRDEKSSTILLTREQPGFGLRAGDAAEDIFVGKFVCSDSELALDSFERLLKSFGSSGIGQIWDVGKVLLDERGFQFGKDRGDLAWVSERVPE